MKEKGVPIHEGCGHNGKFFTSYNPEATIQVTLNNPFCGLEDLCALKGRCTNYSFLKIPKKTQKFIVGFVTFYPIS